MIGPQDEVAHEVDQESGPLFQLFLYVESPLLLAKGRELTSIFDISELFIT